MNATAITSGSLAFAQREVLLSRHRVGRALEHFKVMNDLDIPAVHELAEHHVIKSVQLFRSAIGKRAFEIRQLCK
jgi:hypothetical protein